MQLTTNAELEARQAERDAIDEAARAAQQTAVTMSNLASHVKKCFDDAVNHRMSTGLENRLLEAMRAKRGEYDPQKLQDIQSMGGSDVYARVTATKSRAAASWLRDALLTKDRPWTLTPTSQPKLQGELDEKVNQRVREEIVKAAMFQHVLKQQHAQMMQQGYQGPAPEMPPPPTAEQILQRMDMVRRDLRREERAEAYERIEDAEIKVDDVLQEGGFYRALDEFVDDVSVFPYAVIKGPVLRRKPSLAWQKQGDGTFKPVVQDDIKHEFYRVSPFDFYWSPMAGTVDDGWVIERHRMRGEDLGRLLGVPGYDDEAIRQALRDYREGGLRDWLALDSSRDTAEGKSSWRENTDPQIDALEFTGHISGSKLLQHGLDPAAIPDPDIDYFCTIWVVGRHVIKARINDDPLGRKPYGLTSWERLPGSMAGNGLADMLADVQSSASACLRALVNNMGIASGPQVQANLGRLAPGVDPTTMYPWKVWGVEEDIGGSGAPAVSFFQPNSNAAELLTVYKSLLEISDDWSSIPRYMQGNTSVGTLGRTASGLSMIMNSANKGMTQVLSNIDRYVIKPVIEYLYYYLMRYDPDNSFKGDLQVVARGASGVLLREAAQQRTLEFLQITANPIDAQILGMEGREKLLKDVYKMLDLNPIGAFNRSEGGMPQQAGAPQPGQPQGQPQMQQPAAPAMGGRSGQQLADGSPTVDNFSPTA